VSNAFFTSLGRHLLEKRAGRIPWGVLIKKLREEHVVPEAVPSLPFIEPEPLPVPVQPIGPAIPEEVIDAFVGPLEDQKEPPAPEPRPKSKPEGKKTPTPD
jgi:hypothetical protein